MTFISRKQGFRNWERFKNMKRNSHVVSLYIVLNKKILHRPFEDTRCANRYLVCSFKFQTIHLIVLVCLRQLMEALQALFQTTGDLFNFHCANILPKLKTIASINMETTHISSWKSLVTLEVLVSQREKAVTTKLECLKRVLSTDPTASTSTDCFLTVIAPNFSSPSSSLRG